MSRPDDYRGAPPGGSWPPADPGPAGPPTGWTAEPGRPASAPGWPSGADGSYLTAGSGGPYPAAGGGGAYSPAAGGPSYPAAGGGGAYPAAGGPSYPAAGGGGAYPPAAGGPSYPATGGGGTYPPAAGGPSGYPSATSAGPDGGGAHRSPLDPAKLFGIVIAALGALNFVFGFLPQVTASRIDETLSVYAVGPGYVPILLLIAGLLALAAFLPGSERSRLAVAAVSVGGAVGAVVALGTASSLELLAAGQVSKGLGAVLLAIFGLIQAVVAIAAYVVGADMRLGARGRAPADGRPGAGDPVPAVVGGPSAAPAPPPWFTPATPPAPEPAGYYPGYAPVPGGPAAPAGPGPQSSWAPPADDDRPTGPHPVITPAMVAGAESEPRRTAAERELPRVAPGWSAPSSGNAQPTGSGHPVGLTKESDSTSDTRPRPADDQRPARPQAPDEGVEGDAGVTEVYRIPPRTTPDGGSTTS